MGTKKARSQSPPFFIALLAFALLMVMAVGGGKWSIPGAILFSAPVSVGVYFFIYRFGDY